MTVALLLPITYGLEPASALIMFAGIFYGGMYGGSTTSILLNTPGESSSVVTAIEGNKMAQGRPGRAGAGDRGDRLVRRRHDRHAAAGAGRAAGGRSSRSAWARRTTSRSCCSRSSRVDRGARLVPAPRLRALLLGLAIGLVGIDKVTGQQRLTFGIPQLADGIDVVVVAVGIFAVGEALWVAAHLRRNPAAR